MVELFKKPHAVCIPYPAQGHVTPMMQLAELLHCKGFHITFVNTHYNQQRLIRSRGADAVRGCKDFVFKSIPDGLPASDPDRTQDIPALCECIGKLNLLPPFLDLVEELNRSADRNPPVTCIISDGVMSFTHEVAEQLGVPLVYFWTASACGFWGYFHYLDLIEKGYTPLKDERQLTNGYLDTRIDWIPGMPNIEMKYLPSFIRTLDRDDTMFNFCKNEARTVVLKGSALILNTFDELEQPVVDAIRSRLPRLYTIGPLDTINRTVLQMNGLAAINSSLWVEEEACLDWLGEQEEDSVVYVNFGSTAVITPQQMEEFAWGLANSKRPFLWVIRPDLVKGDASMVPKEFVMETKKRGLLASWCPQKDVLNHPSVGLFLTHCGWNSTIESICGGVPMLCWPLFAEQTTNCRYASTEWGIGMEIGNDVERGQIENQVTEMMEGEKGKAMRRRAREWQETSRKAALPGGSSYSNVDRFIGEVLLKKMIQIDM